MLLTLIFLFIVGYMAIALEHPLKVDKAAPALVLGMLMWVVYAMGTPSKDEINLEILHHMGDITQTLFFLIGAMTVVELVDVNDGFKVITQRITTRRKRRLLYVLCTVAFFMSAVLDNLTTTIVMLMLLRKLVADKNERWLYAGMIVIAANTGGAWSPIGDVTTIMLWVKGNVSTGALISHVLLPSIVALVVPMLIVSRWLKGDLETSDVNEKESQNSEKDRRLIFCLGVGGLLFVPVFKQLTHLPPFMGILFVLGLLWIYTEVVYSRRKLRKSQEHRLSTVLQRIDISTILFFFGILMAVAVLEASGILGDAAGWLDKKVHNIYVINMVLGTLSSIVDNVPLVAAAMGMYPVADAGAVGYQAAFMVDGVFWEFLSYCAGVGGSILIIGSAAGVIAMGMEKIPFGWYLKKFSLLALLGYLAGAAVYIAQVTLL